MREHSHARSLEALRAAAAEFVSRESNGQSLITVTRVDLSGDGKHAVVFISVLPSEKAKAAFDFTNRKRGELREYLKERTIMGRLPRIEFALDTQDGANQG